jgi:DNA-binding transcriptional ArsR family regulator
MDKFAALADPTRRTIIEILAIHGQLCASEISDRFRVSPSAISQHLKVLHEANLVKMEKQAQQRLYRINPEPLRELEEWVSRMRELWDERSGALDKVLQEEMNKQME